MNPRSTTPANVLLALIACVILAFSHGPVGQGSASRAWSYGASAGGAILAPGETEWDHHYLEARSVVPPPAVEQQTADFKNGRWSGAASASARASRSASAESAPGLAGLSSAESSGRLYQLHASYRL